MCNTPDDVPLNYKIKMSTAPLVSDGGKWTEEMCGCTKDCMSCMVVWCLPFGGPIIQAVAVDKATEGGKCVPFLCSACFCAFGMAVNRGKIRERYNIDGNYCADCCAYLFCGPCMTCQEYREVNARKDK